MSEDVNFGSWSDEQVAKAFQRARQDDWRNDSSQWRKLVSFASIALSICVIPVPLLYFFEKASTSNALLWLGGAGVTGVCIYYQLSWERERKRYKNLLREMQNRNIKLTFE
jgi:hypothetical protein